MDRIVISRHSATVEFSGGVVAEKVYDPAGTSFVHYPVTGVVGRAMNIEAVRFVRAGSTLGLQEAMEVVDGLPIIADELLGCECHRLPCRVEKLCKFI